MVTVSELHRFSSSYYMRGGWAAEVTASDGVRAIVSRYDGEECWIADGYYAPSCSWFPVYWNGEGSRCTALRAVPAPAAAALDAAVAASPERTPVAS